MFETGSDAFGDTRSGCLIRQRLYASQNSQLAGWEDVLLIDVVKLAERKPAEAASPAALALAAASSQHIVAASGGQVFVRFLQGRSWAVFLCIPSA